MKTWMRACLVASALVFGLADTGRAHWRRDCGPSAAVGFEERTITCYRPEYHTEYREIQRTAYRCVPETHEQEIRETVLVPHWREEERQRTVLVPQTREETRQCTVMRTEWRTEQRQRTVSGS
jgi:hypothetical protein